MMDCIMIWNPLEEDEQFEFKLILNELISNGLTHGNARCEDKSLVASIREIDSNTISIYIEDEGEGFNHRNFFCDNWPIYMEGGRGLKIIRELCDQIQFYRNGSHIEVYKSIKRKI